MSNYKRAVGLFYTSDETEAALRALKEDNFDLNNINVFAKNADQVNNYPYCNIQSSKSNKVYEGAETGATTGAVFGGLGGLLVGLGTLAIPGAAPIIIAGEIATTIFSTLVGAGLGATAGGLLGAMVGLGIPEDQAKIYSDRIAEGSYLVVVNGSNDEIDRAKKILIENGIDEFYIYDAPAPDDSAKNKPTTNIEGKKQGIGNRR